MNRWPELSKHWVTRSITTKFSLAFAILLFLLFSITVVSIGALTIVRRAAENSLFISAHLQHLVLEMDRHLEKSRRLELDFFLRYPQIGFSAAYERYAQPAEEQVKQVQALSEELRRFIDDAEMTEVWQKQKRSLTLYHTTVARQTVSIQEATMLVSRLANETDGLYVRLARHASQISELTDLDGQFALHQLFHDMQDFEREYFLSGQRPLMQSAFNVAFELKQAVEKNSGLGTHHKEQILYALDAYQAVAEEILDLNVTLRSLFNEFDLQANAIDPIAEEFISEAHQEIVRSRSHVSRMSLVVTILLLITAFAGFGLAGATGIMFNNSVTRNIIKLTQSAKAFQSGRLHERARIESGDELGLLADSFNMMAARLEELIESLEEKVVARTIALSTSNRHLQEEMTVRQHVEEELKRYTGQLENMVDERTRELRQTQDDLVQREKLATLGQLAGGVAHELRHPLGVLSNAAYFLNMTLSDADKKTEEYLEIIMEEVQKSQNIISALLNFAGAKAAQPEKLDVSMLVSRLLKEHPAPEAIHVKTEFAQPLPPAYVDPVHVELVIGNLVKNAYQAMPEGGVLLIRTQVEQQRVRLSVSDTGCGMSTEAQKRLFEPLFTTKMRGIGLGLAISKNLIESNGGSIEVESEEGEGTTFIIVLPIYGKLLS